MKAGETLSARTFANAIPRASVVLFARKHEVFIAIRSESQAGADGLRARVV